MLLRSLSTVLAQDHFYSDFLSLLLTKQIHFEFAKMMALVQHSLSVLTFVKLMIERAVHLLSRFVFCRGPLGSYCVTLCSLEALGTGSTPRSCHGWKADLTYLFVSGNKKTTAAGFETPQAKPNVSSRP